MANSLLLLFLSLLIAPISSFATSSNLPECCRRGGAHHCAALASGLSGEAAFHSQNDCPMQHLGHVAATSAALPMSVASSISAETQHLAFTELPQVVSASKHAGRERAPPINS